MSLPLWLAQGKLSIYSLYPSGVNGVPAPSGYNWGLVGQVSLYGIYHVEVGNKVLYSGSGAKVIRYGSWNYTIIDQTAILATAT